MATAIIGAAVGAIYGAGSATMIAALGSGLAAGLAGAAIGGAVGAVGGDLMPGGAPEQVSPVASPTDKTTAQKAEQLDALELGDESKKRKRSGSKSKFKIEKSSIGENIGVVFKGSTKAPDTATAGVQL